MKPASPAGPADYKFSASSSEVERLFVVALPAA